VAPTGIGVFHGLVAANSGSNELVDVEPVEDEPDVEDEVVVVETVSASCAMLLSDIPDFVAYALTVADVESGKGAL
jgi:hypothetical protein